MQLQKRHIIAVAIDVPLPADGGSSGTHARGESPHPLRRCGDASLSPPRPPKLGGQRDRDEVDDHARGGSLGTSARAVPSGPRCPPDSAGPVSYTHLTLPTSGP